MENTNSYQLTTSVNDGILEVLITGTATGHLIPRIQKELQALRAEQGNIMLVDIRAVSKGKTHTYANTFYYIKIPDNATGKTAILDVPENEYVKSIIEEMPWGPSLEVKWFDNIDEAKNWLKSSGCNTI